MPTADGPCGQSTGAEEIKSPSNSGLHSEIPLLSELCHVKTKPSSVIFPILVLFAILAFKYRAKETTHIFVDALLCQAQV